VSLCILTLFAYVTEASEPPDLLGMPIHARIEAVRQIANKIEIDGRGDDWRGVPRFADPPDQTADPSRDITAVTIAPRRDDLLVLIETAGDPSPQDLAFWLDLDLAGDNGKSFQIGLSRSGNHVLWNTQDGATEPTTVQLSWRFGDVVEIQIPYDVLPPLKGTPRPWVRVTAFTWHVADRARIDTGPAVASYRLVADPSLDQPIRTYSGQARAIPLPVGGQWHVIQGENGPWTHQGIWAYDLQRVDAAMQATGAIGSRDNKAYYSWDQAVTAPVGATVLRTRHAVPDEVPLTPENAGPTNEVFLDIGGSTGLWLAHFRENTISVRQGARVKQGAELGRVGNSGNRTWPHLHIGLWRLPEGRVTLPMDFQDVRVSLNPVEDDPWQRDLHRWSPRSGFLVKAIGN